MSRSTSTSAPPAVLIRRPEVTARTGLSRTTLYRMIKAGAFPAPRQISYRAVAWVESDITAWVEGLASGTRATGSNPSQRG